jgi:acetoacetyl-CoA synthetase
MSAKSPEPEAPFFVPASQTREGSQLAAFIGYCREHAGRPFRTYAEFDAFSRAEWNLFWKLFLEWSSIPYDGNVEPTSTSESCEAATFFPNVSLNYAEALLEPHRTSDRVALTAWHGDRDPETVTGAELHRRVTRLALALRRFGVQPGDRVVAIARNGSEAIVAALATSAIGGVFASCAPDMGAKAILSRFAPLRPVVLVANFRAQRGDEGAPVAARVLEVASSIDSLTRIIALDDIDDAHRAGVANVAVETYSELISRADDEALHWIRFPFNHPLFIMFSSGTTGPPKCIVHGAGGTLVEHLKEHLLHCDLRRGDKLFFQTSCAWMMWNWQLSALASGSEIVVFDGRVTGPETIWEITSKEAVTVLGTSPSYLQLCAKASFSPVKDHRFASLRSVLSTGSILPDWLYDWVRDQVKPLPLQSISGGTDILGCFVLGNPGLPVFRGQAQCRSLGLDVQSWNGELVCTNPFPSRPLGLFGDDDGSRFHEAYFSKNPSVWTHGDLIEFTPQGGARIHGRSDGVLNIRGIRIGPAEIYSILESVDAVLEAMAVEQEIDRDPANTRLLLLVVLRGGVTLDAQLEKQIRSTLAVRGSASFVPGLIVQVDALPVTLNGKRSETAARDAVNGNRPRNFEALSNPQVIPAISKAVEEAAHRGKAAAASSPASVEWGAVGSLDQLRDKVLGTFERALGRTPDPADNYLEMGLDSLHMMTVLMALEEALGIGLSDEVFSAPTINELSEAIWHGLSAEERASKPNAVHVRRATADDTPRIVELLREGFGPDEREPQTWSALLSYEWISEKPNLGFVLMAGERIVGFVGTVFSRRKDVVVCNLSSWYVLPKYRGWGALLLRAALQDETVSYVSLTPGPEAAATFRALHFWPVERKKIYLLPFADAETLLHRRPELELRHERIRELLSPEERRIFDDHQPYDCLHLVVRDGAEHAYVVCKKRPFRRPYLKNVPGHSLLSYSEVLYCSAPELLSRHVERVKLTVLWRQRTLALQVGEQMLGSPLPRGGRRKQLEFYSSTELAADPVDLLYSELVLLRL